MLISHRTGTFRETRMLNRLSGIVIGLLLGITPPALVTVSSSAVAAEKKPAAAGASLAPVPQQLELLEQERIAAIAAGDASTLGKVLADDYVHVHGTGHVDDKTGFIKSIVERPRQSTRGPLTIRVYGDMAVITGEQVNRSVNADKSVTSTTYVATQVARRVEGQWRLVSMQLTPKTAN